MKFSPAERVWLFIIGGALAYDVLAIKEHWETLSEWCRRHPKTTVLVSTYLLLHWLGPNSLSRFDPLGIAANKLRGF
jgi:hypothetical protein